MLFLLICILSVYFLYKLSLCRKKCSIIKNNGENSIVESYGNYYKGPISNKLSVNNSNNDFLLTPKGLPVKGLQNYTFPVINNNTTCASSSDLTPKFNKKLVDITPHLKPPNDPRYNNINYVIYDTNPDALPPYPDYTTVIDKTIPTVVENTVPTVPTVIDKPITDIVDPQVTTVIDNNLLNLPNVNEIIEKRKIEPKCCNESVYINNDGKVSAVENIKSQMVPVVPISDPYRENKIIGNIQPGDIIPNTNPYTNDIAISAPPINIVKQPSCTPIPLEIVDYANKHLDYLKKSKKKKKKCLKKRVNYPVYNYPHLVQDQYGRIIKPVVTSHIPQVQTNYNRPVVTRRYVRPTCNTVQKQTMQQYIKRNDTCNSKSSCCM